MNRRPRINLRWPSEALFQRQPCADHCASRGADDEIGSPEIDSLTSQTIHQTNFPSLTHGAAATKHECPRTVASADRAAVIYHFRVPSLRAAAWKALQSIALRRMRRQCVLFRLLAPTGHAAAVVLLSAIGG